jgi:hypothetical protein
VKQLSNTKKFQEAYNRQYEVEKLLDNRLENGMTQWERKDLIKEFEKLGKCMTSLCEKISEEQFEEFLESNLCCDYCNFIEGWQTEYVM